MFFAANKTIKKSNKYAINKIEKQYPQALKYDTFMTKKYEKSIHDEILQIGDGQQGDFQLSRLDFIEKFNIKTLILQNNKNIILKLRSQTIKELHVQINFVDSFDDEVGDPVYFYRNETQLKLCFDDLDLENLEVLTLVDNRLESNQIAQIERYKKLRVLDLSFNDGVDLTHFYNMTSLTKLGMCRCGLKSIDQIKYLVNLEELYLDDNYKINITPLQYLVKLQVLYLNSCEISQVWPLRTLVNLKSLLLKDNWLDDVMALYFLVNLTNLSLQNCNLVSVFPLRSLVNLEWLNLHENHLSYIDCIDFHAMKNLKYLNIVKNSVKNVTNIVSHPNYGKQFEIHGQGYFSAQRQHPHSFKVQVVESSFLNLKSIQNAHSASKQTIHNFKLKINTVTETMCSEQIAFTSKVVHLFQQMNEGE
ncbi:leucine-rich_repeat domain-containing protein [Hexamita inflata]|uniref:Leucine-rich_repeat domain-containing protein n=1 Tax=Hexamita inflata TaxID=28002 RepID=A0ABP1H702_9EUKA